MLPHDAAMAHGTAEWRHRGRKPTNATPLTTPTCRGGFKMIQATSTDTGGMPGPLLHIPRLELNFTLVGLGRLNLGLMGPVARRAGFRLFGVNLARPEDTPAQKELSQRKVATLNSSGYYLLQQTGDAVPQHIEIEGASCFDECAS